MNNSSRLIIKALCISALILGVIALCLSIHNYNKAVKESIALIIEKQNIMEQYIEDTQYTEWADFMVELEFNNTPAQ